jgi:hypothetical protein
MHRWSSRASFWNCFPICPDGPDLFRVRFVGPGLWFHAACGEQGAGENVKHGLSFQCRRGESPVTVWNMGCICALLQPMSKQKDFANVSQAITLADFALTRFHLRWRRCFETAPFRPSGACRGRLVAGSTSFPGCARPEIIRSVRVAIVIAFDRILSMLFPFKFDC